MLYISGVHALNIENSLNTCGDWHTSSLNWSDIKLVNSEQSLFGNWGIELNKKIPEHTELFNVANDLRAILDLMLQNNLGFLKGFYDDFICTDEYNAEFFSKVQLLKNCEHWSQIDELMKQEFMFNWIDYCKGVTN